MTKGENMIEIKGTRKEVAEAVKGISATYPTGSIEHLVPGEWFFIVNGVEVKLIVERDSE